MAGLAGETEKHGGAGESGYGEDSGARSFLHFSSFLSLPVVFPKIKNFKLAIRNFPPRRDAFLGAFSASSHSFRVLFLSNVASSPNHPRLPAFPALPLARQAPPFVARFVLALWRRPKKSLQTTKANNDSCRSANILRPTPALKPPTPRSTAQILCVGGLVPHMDSPNQSP